MYVRKLPIKADFKNDPNAYHREYYRLRRQQSTVGDTKRSKQIIELMDMAYRRREALW